MTSLQHEDTGLLPSTSESMSTAQWSITVPHSQQLERPLLPDSGTCTVKEKTHMQYFNVQAFILQQKEEHLHLLFSICQGQELQYEVQQLTLVQRFSCVLLLTQELSPGCDHLAMCSPEIPNHTPEVFSLKGY